ncbi:MAG: mechanosensitive ion channel domain-containing protein, partial [Pseudomonadota bacterium]
MLQEIDNSIKIHRLWWNFLRHLGLKGEMAQWSSDISLGMLLLCLTYFIYRIMYSFVLGERVKDVLSFYIKESKVSLIQEEILLYLLRLFICIFFVGISYTVLDSTTAKLFTLPVINFLSRIYMVFLSWYICHHSLYVANDIYRSYKVGRRLPISSYIQTLQIIIFIIFIIILYCIIFEVNLSSIFTGLSAMAAVILLVFKDSITGFVASFQIALVDIVRVGDWITIPSLKVDGNVIELSVWNTKIRNFDKTIVTIPSHALINTSVINWRGMQIAGGRRIKKSVMIDVNTINIVDEKLLSELRKNDIVKNVVNDLMDEVNHTTSNLMLFRAYLENYFREHLNIYDEEGFTCLVRVLQPTELGIPLEVYVFTKTTVWKEYE